MAKRVEVQTDLTAEELQKRYRQTTDAVERTHWQILWQAKEGKTPRDLGKPLSALPYLELAEKSLATANSVTPRWHALLEISRAQAFCDAGDIATGVELACKGFTMAYQCRSPRQMNRVRKLLRKLEKGPFRDHPRVQDLKNLLYETYMHMDSEDSPANPPRSPL